MANADCYTTDTGEKRYPAFWDCSEDGGELRCETIDEAVEYRLDDLDKADWPEKLTVYGYAPVVATVRRGMVLDNLLEHLDSEYGVEFRDAMEPTDRMREAERVFVETVLSLYEVGNCDIVETVVIDVNDWVKANCPSWLDGKRRPWERVDSSVV